MSVLAGGRMQHPGAAGEAGGGLRPEAEGVPDQGGDVHPLAGPLL